MKIHLEGMRQEISKSFEEKFMRDLLKPIYSEKIVEISQEEFRAELNGSSGDDARYHVPPPYSKDRAKIDFLRTAADGKARVRA